MNIPVNLLPSIAKHDYIVVGERHGTVECPRNFGHLVTSINDLAGQVAVGLEMNEGNQTFLDEYALTRDETVLRSLPHFLTGTDGRSSQSMYDLIKNLGLRAGLKLFAFDVSSEHWNSFDDQGRDDAMAKRLGSCKEMIGNIPFVILCGNIHSSKQLGSFFDSNFRSMALTLSAVGNLYSILIVDDEMLKGAEDLLPILSAVPKNAEFVESGKELFVGHDALYHIPVLTTSPVKSTSQLQ